MQVTNIRVSFMREKQPVQYEKAQPMVELSAVLEDHETDHLLAARSLMMDAATVVYAGIGYEVPDKVAQALASGQVPAQATATVEKVEAPEAASEAPVEAKEEKPKRRGRPAGSRNTGPSKQAAKKAAEEAAAESEIPGEEVPNISANPEDRVDPNADDIPGEEVSTDAISEPVAVEYTNKDFHDLITQVVTKEKKLSVQNAKQVLAHFKVARARDLTPEQAPKARDMVLKMLEAS